MGRFAALLLLLAGCNQIFGLREPLPRDALVPPDLPPVYSDEDLDGFDNALDNCPGTYNPHQDDSDGDGVGDACDPHIGGHDSIVVTQFFNEPYDPWTTTDPAAWTLGGGSLTTNHDVTATNEVLALATDIAQPSVELGFKVLAFDTAGGAKLSVHLVAGDDTQCEIGESSTGTSLRVIRALYNSSYDGGNLLSTPVSNGAPNVVRMTFDSTHYECTFDGLRFVSSHAVPMAPQLTSASIEVHHFQAELAYVILYRYEP